MHDSTEKKHFTMSIDADLFEKVVKLKREGGYESMSAVVRELIRQALSSDINWAAVIQARSDAMAAVSRWGFAKLREFHLRMAKELEEAQ